MYKGAESSAFSLLPEYSTQWPERWALVRCTDGETKVGDQNHLLSLREGQRGQAGIRGAGGQHVVPAAHPDPHTLFGQAEARPAL